MSSLETCSGGGQLRIDSLVGFVGQLQHLYVVPLLLTAVIGTVRSLSHPSKIFEVHNQLSDEYCSNGPLQLLAHLRPASSYEKTALTEDHQIRVYMQAKYTEREDGLYAYLHLPRAAAKVEREEET